MGSKQSKPNDIYVSLETAQALHDAGIVVDSYFHWWRDGYGYFIDKWIDFGGKKLFATRNGKESYYVSSAPTAAELVNGIGHIDINLVFHYGSIKGCAWNKSKLMFVETTWHKKLCEVYADIRLKLKKAGYECEK